MSAFFASDDALNLSLIHAPAEFLYIPKVESTMDVAAECLQAGEPHLTAIFAEEQTLGRGMRGKSWHHVAGKNIAMTVILREAYPQQLALLVALCLRKATQPFVQSKVRVKWPNDLKLRGRKLAGILVEKRKEGYLVGIGMNVLPIPREELPLDFPGIDLAAGKVKQMPLRREDVLNAFFDMLVPALESFQQEGWLPFALEYAKHCETLGKRVGRRMNTPQGEQVLEGIATGLNEDGTLELKTADGQVHAITAGEIIAQV